MSNRDEFIKSMKENLPDKDQLKVFEKLAEEYKDKSENEIFFEIIRINKEMEEDLSPQRYKEILDKLDNVRPLLTPEQIKKLDLVLKVIKGKE